MTSGLLTPILRRKLSEKALSVDLCRQSNTGARSYSISSSPSHKPLRRRNDPYLLQKHEARSASLDRFSSSSLPNTCLEPNPEKHNSDGRNLLSSSLSGTVLALGIVLLGLELQVEVKAEEERVQDDKVEKEEENEMKTDEAEKEEQKKEKVGFRDRKIIDYENRIRNYSTPEKIFRYFASYKIGEEIYMTPEDFLRSITPGVKQPEGIGLDQYRKYSEDRHEKENSEIEFHETSIFRKLSSRGLISFSDYIFLLTILSTSRRQFEIAFRKVTLNHVNSLLKVQSILRAGTSWAGRHKEGPGHQGHTGHSGHAGQSGHSGHQSAILVHFFGDKGDGKLTIDQFLEFQDELQSEILRLEFERKEPNEDGFISEKQFAELLLTYADYSPRKRTIVLKRIKKLFKEDGIGISVDDYMKIFQVLVHIEDIDKALTYHHLAGSSIKPDTLLHVAKVCANVDLSEHVVRVLFAIFDEDGDGALSKKEFISVMRNKLKRGLEKPKDTGVTNLISSLYTCATERFRQ
ncbi:calcium uptake protein 1 homolog, mitochondrial [Eurytemora carolleeae]|uniref:calcium uptake protein 1 homolog, mitochondrial n=1 Tax=Eurytemora carolleeae TaxID=1294199 RepID=UPI000C770711|nr:calcium uptake protein 1 homolog, mitochondrial [Eurytemora carolleeae]|eukprot:XP_023347582.1 calcium uptake protein 1 homolog, mitochondrial-like [Eurytemora affinis]